MHRQQGNLMSHDLGTIATVAITGLIYLVFANSFAGKSGDAARDRSQAKNYRLLGSLIAIIAVGFGTACILHW